MNLSLAELDALDKTPANPPPPPPPIRPGDGNDNLPNLEAERHRQAKEQEAANIAAGKNADGSEKTPADPAQKAVEQLAEEQRNIAAGKNADGSEKTAEQLKEEEESAAAEEDELALWEDVDKLWGETLEVKYKDTTGADVHPNTPEGIFLRDKAIEARAINRFEEFMQKRDPRSYEYILHRQAGGTDEDFFARKTVTLPAYEEFQNSVDLKSRVVSESLRIKGVPENVIKLTIDDAIKNKTLDPLAEGAYKEVQTAQQKEINRLNAETAAENQRFERNYQILDKSLKEEMSSGMKIVIPEAKRAAFDTYVREHLQNDGQQFFIVNPIDQKNLPRLLDAMYFQFANGNLADLVQRNAQTQNVKRLQRHVQQNNTPPKSGELPANRKKTLGEL